MAGRKTTSAKPTRPTPPQAGDPEVLLDVECVDERISLVLINVGPLTAFDVQVQFKRPLVGVGGEVVISDQRIFQGLPMLRPGQAIRVFVDTRPALLARRQAKVVKAEVSYRARGGRRLGEAFRHDLRLWDDRGEVR